MPAFIEGVSHLDKQELHSLINDSTKSDVIIIDVRELEEYEEGHIPNIPLLSMGNIPDVMDQFDKDAEYVFICRSGRRSLEVSKFFQNEGIEKVHNFLGGMLTWDKEVNIGQENVIHDFSMKALERKSNK